MTEHHEDMSMPDPHDLAIDRATGDAPAERSAGIPQTEEDRAAAALQSALAPASKLPPALRDRLIAEGEALVGTGSGGPAIVKRRSASAWLGLAAGVLIAGASISVAVLMVNERTNELRTEREQVALLRERIEQNDATIAEARTALASLEAELSASEGLVDTQRRQLAMLDAKNIEIAGLLAEATGDLELARIKIDKYETPIDPVTLAENRTKLLEVPDTVRLAWAPFSLPGAAPAEQPDVTGDVVWNDELETGYLRFVGLPVNDPAMEQYQVWVIDERGMEQKVSGGVFNATADGEIIVPIEPGIDVGSVQVFAITVEAPGGIWVPDLKRRVVVAPRGGEDE